MRSKKHRVILAAIALYTALTLMSATAQAATPGTNITTSPVSVALTGKPGEKLVTTLHVQNNNSAPVVMDVGLQTFRASGQDGRAQITKPAANDPSIGWVHFSVSQFTANPGVWTDIPMTVDLPPNAALDYYYAVQFKPHPAASPQKGSNTVAGSNVVLVLVNAHTPGAIQKLELVNFSADRKSYEYLPAAFTVTARNSGTVFFAPHGDIHISRDKHFRTSLATIPVNSSSGNILPKTNRNFQADWKDGFPLYSDKTLSGQPILDSKGKPQQQLRWDFTKLSNLRIGKYYAQVVLVYNDGQRDVPVYGVTSFWVIPWKMLLLVLFVLLLLVGGMFGLGRFLYRHVPRLARRR